MSLSIERQGGLSGVVQVQWTASITDGEPAIHTVRDKPEVVPPSFETVESLHRDTIGN